MNGDNLCQACDFRTADRVIAYLMKSKFVDEVFADDQTLERTIVATIAGFRRAKLH